ncbi:hypothetical protein ACODT3_02285 [Streptomyces sp. 4.24]|uniref:hypothetical protein n=1 Tax=Streptomyces tritrimontium TaxID=3406573 RepID=UPI003BB792BE
MDGRQWLVTAGHCYGLGGTVHTAGGTRVGTVGAKLDDIDSAFIETPTSRHTWDGLDAQGYTRSLNGVRNAAVGDFTWGSASTPDNRSTIARPGDSGGPVIEVDDVFDRFALRLP